MVNNSLVKTEGKKTFSNFLMGETIKKKINETVGGANGQRFITSILSAVSTNPALQEKCLCVHPDNFPYPAEAPDDRKCPEIRNR